MTSEQSTTVTIFGSDYKIKGEADSERIRKAAAYVDEKMRQVTQEVHLSSASRTAILAALHIADELYREREAKETAETSLGQIRARIAALETSLFKVLEGERRPIGAGEP
jgi:cell division protein ZapA